MKRDKIINVVVTATRTRPGIDSKFLNMTFMTNESDVKDLYVEFTDVDISEALDTEFGKDAYNALKYKQHDEIDLTIEEYNLRSVKKHNRELYHIVRDHLASIVEDNNAQLLMWVNDITIWEKFLLEFFEINTEGLIEFPIHDISLTPIDVGTLFRLPYIRKESEHKTIQDANEIMGITDNMTVNSLSEAAFITNLLKSHKWI